MCSAEVQADVARLKSAAPAAVPDGRTGLATLSGEQVFFTLRVKLLAGCRAGVPFTTAWEYSTALLLEQLAPREAKGWATVFDATRSEWSAAYRAHSRRPK